MYSVNVAKILWQARYKLYENIMFDSKLIKPLKYRKSQFNMTQMI